MLRIVRHFNRFVNFKIVLSDACRSLEFTPPHDGHALVNHVMMNITVDRQDSCRVSCYLDDYCLSYNFGRLKDRHFVCQLSDSDHIQHPEDLKKIDGFVYLGTEVIFPIAVLLLALLRKVGNLTIQACLALHMF